MENNGTSAELFWNIFSEEFRNMLGENKNTIFDSYCNDKKWTEIMTKNFLINLASKFDYVAISTEYWPRVDVGYFINSPENSDEEIGSNWSKWSFEVAIEHENKVWPAWQDECNKLIAINAGLKVLITYRDNTKGHLEEKLKEFQIIYTSRKYHQQNDQWLFIIAPNMNLWDTEDFLAYKFDGIKIVEITNGKNVFQ